MSGFATIRPEEAIRFVRNNKNALDHLRRKVGFPAVVWNDVRLLIIEALSEGTTRRQFYDRFYEEIIVKHKWECPGDTSFCADPFYELFRRKPGHVLSGRISSFVYANGLTMAYAAMRYEQMTDPYVLEERPYWMYRHSGDEIDGSPCEGHRIFDGLVIPALDTFWKVHYPPNGWGCGCQAFSLSREGMIDKGLSVGKPPQGIDIVDLDFRALSFVAALHIG